MRGAAIQDQDGCSNVELSSLFLIAMRMSNHSRHSGYDLIADAMTARRIETTPVVTLGRRALGRALRPLIRRSGSAWYQRENLLAELTAARFWVARRRSVFHFLYGENSFRYLAALKTVAPRRNAIVATFHTPIWRLRELVRNDAHIAHADAIVVMARSQAAYFADRVGEDRVHFVPHGIDTSFFAPGDAAPREGPPRCITVGHHLRDFDTLEALARTSLLRKLDATFVLVSQPQTLARFEGLSNVECHSHVDDTTLLDLYRSADVLLLPLIDATANNALLEGMACGLPVITTDLPAVHDYVNAAHTALTPRGDVAALFDATQDLLQDQTSRRRMGDHSRRTALALDWAEVGRATRRIYHDALARLA